MKTFLSTLITIFFISTLSACGSSSVSNTYNQPVLVAVDSTNDRLFILEKDGILFTLKASDRSSLGSQPAVNNNRATSIYEVLPLTPTNIEVINVSGTSRLFITGMQEDSNGYAVSHRILVIDFDGSSLSLASFSPISLDDGDAGTDESHNVIGGLEVDSTNLRLYATDASAGRLYTYNVTDGSEDAASIAIAGTPNKMSLDNGRLYIANSTSVEANQVITVVNVSNYADTTPIDLHATDSTPTDDIAVLSNNTGTVMLAKQSNRQIVRILKVDTITYNAASTIAVSNNSAEDGQILQSLGITGAVSRVLLTKNFNNIIYGYVSQSDGTLEMITIQSDLSSFAATALSSIALVLENLAVYADSNGNGQIVFSPASATGDLVSTNVGTDTTSVVF